MTAGDAKVGPVEGAAHGHVPLPDLSRAGTALCELHAMWAGRGEEPVTVYLGLDSGTGRVHVGWIREGSRRAVRLSGPTIEKAMDTARGWTRANPTRAGR